MNKIYGVGNFTTNKNEKSKIRILYFDRTVGANIKEVKSVIVNKIEKLFLSYISLKFKMKFENCLKTNR